MTSLRQKLLDLISATDGRITGIEIERFGMANGQKGATAGRRARELSEDNLITAGYENGWVYYQRLKPPEPKYKMIPEYTPQGTVIMKKVLV